MPDEACVTLGGECTLRAAIEESNNSAGESDEIVFDGARFDGKAATSTIAPAGDLPAIVEPVRINGHQCTTDAGTAGPCVEIDGPSATKPALVVQNTGEGEVVIAGLAVTGSLTGIEALGAGSFNVQSSWFGVKLDGSAGANTTGILLGPGSNEGRIGGEASGTGNVFANNSDGLHVLGANGVRVLGNYFGVEPDGATPAANGKDIEVSSIGEFEAGGTAIGTRVSPAAAATPACDGGCNVISGAVSSGVDLEAEGGLEEAPAVATTVLGNYIGLDASGTASVPNASAGVLVGKAAQTIVGGSKVGEANRINGGEVGVDAGPAAPDLIVRGNLIGVDAAGTASMSPPGEGIFVKSEKLPTPAVEALIADNQIRMEDGVAIAQEGYGATIAENRISGGEVGIETFGSTLEHGNLIESNTIEGSEADGIVVRNNFNEVFGNEIFEAGNAGIWIKGAPTLSVTGNLIGGNTTGSENVIAGSGGDAIEILDRQNTSNEVARNRGDANDGLFIDLIPAKPGIEKDPNHGIEPPEISSLSQASAAGSAKTGATVRVFRKQSAAAGELESFLGEATADAEGNWELVFGNAIPAGTPVAATQTNEGGTSELTPAATAPGAGGTVGGGGGGDTVVSSAGDTGKSAPGDRSRPRTKIVKAARKRSRSTTARFEFESNERGSVFLCKLDDKPFDLCKSPKRYKDLTPGRHVFEVRAIDPAGHADSSPAKSQFTVLD